MQPAAGIVVFRCPKCGKAHRAMQSAVGKPITCSSCRTSFAVPVSDAPPPRFVKTEPVTYWLPLTPAEPQPPVP